MALKSIAMDAYRANMEAETIRKAVAKKVAAPETPKTSFKDTLHDSLTKVNEMQAEKKEMIEEFASGKKQNVHELMITMQKAGLAVSMTSAVRNKVMQSYQELMRMPF